MSCRSDQDFSTGVYRCKDPIKNFKIRVRLQQDKTSLIPLPQFQNNGKGIEGSCSLVENAECEERVFSWQEKVFSQGELLYYQSAVNCHSALEEKYHNEVKELCKNGRPKNRLFSYTDADDYDEMANETNDITTKPVMTYLAKNMSEARKRHRFGYHKGYGKEAYLRNQNIVEYFPSKETKKRNHCLQTSIQTFHILADLSTNESSAEEFQWMSRSEYVLCSLSYDSLSGVLFVTPDFTAACIAGQALPYTIEVDDDARNVFQFWLEHASENLAPEDEEKDFAMLSKVLDRQLDIRQLKFGTEFEMPRSNTFLVYIMGEVVGAEDFEYENLFVHFLFELPEGWTCGDPEQLSGVTHRSSANGRGIACFAHTFETDLTLNVESLPSKLGSVPHWPQFLAEVLSLDSWNRFRVEGYCAVKVPPNPGMHCISQRTWRPLADSPVGEMRRFFVGGTPGLEDISYAGIPSKFQGDRLCKLGLQVTDSGILHLRFNIVHQSGLPSASFGEGAAERHPASLLERLSAATLVHSVNTVIAAFKRARERMLKAKKGLNEDVVEENHQT